MAILKFGPLVSGVRGSIGGLVFTNSIGGPVSAQVIGPPTRGAFCNPVREAFFLRFPNDGGTFQMHREKTGTNTPPTRPKFLLTHSAKNITLRVSTGTVQLTARISWLVLRLLATPLRILYHRFLP